MKTAFLPDEIRSALFAYAIYSKKVPSDVTEDTHIMTLSWHLNQQPTGVEVDVLVATFTAKDSQSKLEKPDGN